MWTATTNAIYEYSGSTGAFLSTFVAAGSGGLNDPAGIVFGPDGNLYVSSTVTKSVDRFEGPRGPSPGSPLPAAGQSGATFVAAGSGGLTGPKDLIFGPDGNLYVANSSRSGNRPSTNSVCWNTTATTGAFITTFVGSGAGGLEIRAGLPSIRMAGSTSRTMDRRDPPLRQPGQLPRRPGDSRGRIRLVLRPLRNGLQRPGSAAGQQHRAGTAAPSSSTTAA